MIILEDLPLEERQRLLNQSKSITPTLKHITNPQIYRSVYSNIYKLRNDELSFVTTEDIIKIILIKEDSNSYELDVEILETKKLQGLEFLPKVYMDVIYKISNLKNHFICQVNKLGIVTAILNKDELKSRWLGLKKELEENVEFEKTFQEEGIRKLIEAGDTQYITNVNSLVAELNKNIVFMSLFLGFTDRKLIQIREFYSYIFPDLTIKAKLNIEDEKEDENQLVYSMAINKTKVDESAIKKKFLRDFAFMQEPYDEHFFDFVSLNTINKETNWIENIKLSIDERINRAVNISILCEIQKIENYE